MSGGSWNYLTYQIEEAAEKLILEKEPSRRAFGKKMLLFAKAMYDIEWVDSGDKGEGDDIESIQKALGKNHKELILLELIEEAKKIKEELAKYCDV